GASNRFCRRGAAAIDRGCAAVHGDARQTSVAAYRSLRERFAQALLVPVHNEILGSSQHRDKYPIAGGGALSLRMPVLAPGLRKYIDTPPFSFAGPDMSNAVGIPLDAHSELQRWLRRIYLEFREIDLRLLLADLQTSMRRSGP